VYLIRTNPPGFGRFWRSGTTFSRTLRFRSGCRRQRSVAAANRSDRPRDRRERV